MIDRLDPALAQVRGDPVDDLAEVGVAAGRALGDEPDDLVVALRVERREREVLELPLDRVHAQPVRERGEHLERLAGLALLLLRRQEPQRAHVVQPVGELDDEHARVAGHRDDHLADRLGLGRLAVLDLVELGDAVDQARDLGPELGLDVGQRQAGVLDGVVQQCRDQRRGVHAEFGEDRRDRERMGDVRVAALAQLALVAALGDVVAALQQPGVHLGVDAAVAGEQRLEHRLDGGLCAARSRGAGPAGRGRAGGARSTGCLRAGSARSAGGAVLASAGAGAGGRGGRSTIRRLRREPGPGRRRHSPEPAESPRPSSARSPLVEAYPLKSTSRVGAYTVNSAVRSGNPASAVAAVQEAELQQHRQPDDACRRPRRSGLRPRASCRRWPARRRRRARACRRRTSTGTSISAVPYSSSYARRTVGGGSLPALRTGTMPQSSATPSAPAIRKPRASMPATRSTSPASDGQRVDHGGERRRVGEQRGDVLEDDARLREVRDVTQPRRDQRARRPAVIDGGGCAGSPAGRRAAAPVPGRRRGVPCASG